MKWLFQTNIWQEYNYDRLLASAEQAGVDFSMVDVIPFTEDFKEPIDFVPDMVFGSNRFVDICRGKGYPVFDSFKPIELFYPSHHWINGHGFDVRWGDLKDYTNHGPIFVKPYREKFFTGAVLDVPSDVDKIQLATSFVDYPDDELVRVSTAREIYIEARMYIIGGIPITGSFYKVNGQPKQYELFYGNQAWTACKSILEQWGSIDDAFVMDLGLISRDNIPDNWKIVELNNINSSGLYKTDTDAIVKAFMNL